MNREAGKGDKLRKGADLEKYADGWDRIFGKKEKRTYIKKHTCPYREQVNGDYKTLCDCSHEATFQCSRDV